MTEHLRERKDSITPPYPEFGEHLRALLNDGHTSRDIARKIGNARTKTSVSESAVNAWASGGNPGTLVRADITRELGYDFGERAFSQAALAIGFPKAGSPEEVRVIRTNAALRDYLKRLFARANMAEFARLIDMKADSNMTNFLLGKVNLSQQVYERILAILDGVPGMVSGAVLCPLTPLDVIGRALLECRVKSGKGRTEYAADLDIDPTYLRYLEDVGQRGETAKGYSKDRDRTIAICEKLTLERARLGIVPIGSLMAEEDEEPPAEEPQAAPAAVVPPPAPALPVPAAPSPATASREEVDALRLRLQEVEDRLAALEQGMAAAPAPAGEAYVSPFSHARWTEHDVPVDGTRVRLVRTLLQQTSEELGFLAQVKDPGRRAEIRREIEPLVFEHLIALEGFCREHPGAALAVFEARRNMKERMGG